MRVLVTGGAGFLGRHVAARLLERGFDVVAFDSLERVGPAGADGLRRLGVPLVVGDVRDGGRLAEALAGVDVVVHAAAYIDVEESFERPAEYAWNNAGGTAAVASACLRRGIAMVYVSSAAVYGQPVRLPVDEDHPLNPISPYGLSKKWGEEAVRLYAAMGLRAAVVRPFNVYGPGQTGSYAGVITRFLERAAKGQPPVIYGDGLQTRDFVHVRDVAALIALVVEREAWGLTVNAGTGRPTAIAELARMVMRLAGVEGRPVYAPPRPGDIRHSWADIARARGLGYVPTVELEEGLRGLLAQWR